MRESRAIDQTQQFFTAGELMEVAGDFGDGDTGRYEDGRSLASRWLALAAASALALLALVIVTN